MPILRYETWMPCSVAELWQFHASTEALQKLTPPERKLEMASSDRGDGILPLEDGALHILRFRLGPFRMEWRARISNVMPPNGFTDTAEKSPFKRWSHRHRFVAEDPGCRLIDEIDYELPFGVLGKLVAPLVRRDLDRLFAFRHARTRETLTQKGPGLAGAATSND